MLDVRYGFSENEDYIILKNEKKLNDGVLSKMDTFNLNNIKVVIMNRSMYFGIATSIAILIWFLSRVSAQLYVGYLKSDDIVFVLIASVIITLIGGIIAKFLFQFVFNKTQFLLNYYLKINLEDKDSYSPTTIFKVVFTLLLIGIGSFGYYYSYTKFKQLAEEKIKIQIQKEIEQSAILEAERLEKERIASLTPEQRANEALKVITDKNSKIINDAEKIFKRKAEVDEYGKAILAGKDKTLNVTPIKTEEWNNLKTDLLSIKKDEPLYSQAVASLKKMEAIDKKDEKIAKETEEKLDISSRKSFAKLIEQSLVENRINADVSVSGNKNTILKIKWALANKVFANDISNSGIIQKAEKAGFKKVIFTDDYNYSCYWDLNK